MTSPESMQEIGAALRTIGLDQFRMVPNHERETQLEAAGILQDVSIQLAKVRALVEKLDAAQAGIDSAFTFAFIHGFKYSGPQYGVELQAVKDALK